MDRRETKDSVRKGIAARAKPDRAYWTVADVANLVKHLELSNPKLPFKLKPEDTHLGREAPFPDGTYFKNLDGTSDPWDDAKPVVCTRDDQDDPIDLRWSLLETRCAIEAYLTSRPELGWPQVPATVDPPAP